MEKMYSTPASSPSLEHATMLGRYVTTCMPISTIDTNEWTPQQVEQRVNILPQEWDMFFFRKINYFERNKNGILASA